MTITRRTLSTALTVAAVLATTVLVTTEASAECRAQRTYTVVDGGYWGSYDALFVPPSSGPVTQTITTTRTHSSTTEVSAELGISADAFVAELNSKFGASYATTATVASGRSTTVTAPPSASNQEIRFGTFKQKIVADIAYYGCAPSDPPTQTTFEYAAKESAGVVTF